MPYIPKTKRAMLEPRPEAAARVAGELSFQVARLCVQYVKTCGRSYITFAEVLGALESTKAEFFRRVVAPYENGKRRQAGDVFEDLGDG